MNTVRDFINVLEKLPEEQKDYILCIDAADGYESIPRLRNVALYINTDIGQVEIEPQYTDEDLNNDERMLREIEKYLERTKNEK